jgi:hypothetical protein
VDGGESALGAVVVVVNLVFIKIGFFFEEERRMSYMVISSPVNFVLIIIPVRLRESGHAFKEVWRD